MSLKPIRNFPRRHYYMHGYGSYCQMDLAVMYPYKGYNYFLLFVDCYSRKIFTESLTDKSSQTTRTALQRIFDRFGAKIEKIDSDKGSEFVGNFKWLKDQQIVLHYKGNVTKAAIAERSIAIVKKRLYLCLRTLYSKNWPKYLPIITDSINRTKNAAINGLRPADIHSIADNPKIDKAINYSEPSYRDEIRRQQQYDDSPHRLKIGTFVYLQDPDHPFNKAYETQVIKIDSKLCFSRNLSSFFILKSLSWPHFTTLFPATVFLGHINSIKVLFYYTNTNVSINLAHRKFSL